jgi:hypothetical protein
MLVTHLITIQDIITQQTVTKAVTQVNHNVAVKLTLLKVKTLVTVADAVDPLVKTVGSGINITQTVLETS